MNAVVDRPTLHAWRPVFWEPVSGTGERLMVGVLHSYDGRAVGARTMRDDVLDSLYGQQSSGAAKKLIDAGLQLLVTSMRVGGIEATEFSVMGLHPGPLRETSAISANDLLRTAALLYSSLSNLDKLDSLEEEDAPLQEEVNRRFSTEVRDLVALDRPDLLPGFGKSGALIDGGQIVKFGYLSAQLVAHFSVLYPTRQSASVRDARARLWEIARAMSVASIPRGALITAVPRHDDATLGERQRLQSKANEREIEREADAVNIRLFPVHNAEEGAEKLIEMA